MDGSTRINSDTEPTELAQASPGGEAVGKVEVIKGNVTITRTDGSTVKAEAGTEIFQGDLVETDAKGSVGLIFADNSTFSLAEDGQMTIDDMIYDPGSQEGTSVMSVAQGVFTFVSGEIAKTGVDNMLVNTPTATIGIRGTSGGGKIGKTDTFTLFAEGQPGEGDDPSTLKGQAGADILLAQVGGTQGRTGEMTIRTQVGQQVLSRPNETTQVSSPYSPPSKTVILPASAVNQFYAAAASVLPASPAASAPTGSGGSSGGGATGDPTAEAGATAEQQTEAGAEAESGSDPQTEGDLGVSGEEVAPEEAGAEAFEQALAEGGSLEDAMAAAANAAGAAETRAVLDADPNAFGTPEAIESSLGGMLSLSLGGLDGPGDPLDSGLGSGSPLDGPGGGDDPFGPGGGFGGEDFFGGEGPGEDFAGEALDQLFADLGLDFFSDPLGLGDGFGEEGFFDAEFFGEEFFDPFDDFDIPEEFLDEETSGTTITFINLGPGSDSHSLVNGEIDDILASSSTDSITLFGEAQSGDLFDGGDGTDTLTFSTDGVSQIIKISNTETIIFSDVGSSNTFLTDLQTGGSISITLSPTGLNDILDISGTSVDLTFVNTVDGSSNNLILVGDSSGDSVTFADGTNVVQQLSNFDTVNIASSSASNLTLQSAVSGVTISATSVGTLTLNGNGNSVNLSGDFSGGVTAASGDDTITLSGSTGASISSGDGADTVTGGSGGDTLTGGGGDDELTGGSGSDTFRFTAVSDSPVGSDTITDFDATDDSERIFLDGLKSGTFSFVGAHTNSFAGGSNTSARFNDTSKVLEIDTDGDGTADMEIILTGVSLANLGAADFLVSGSGDTVANVSGTSNYTLTGNNDVIIGTSSNENLTLTGAAASGDSFDGGDGTDVVNLDNSGNTLALTSVESVVGGSGTDIISLDDSGGSKTFQNVESITGGSGDDAITISANGTVTIDGGAGTDTVNPNSLTSISLHLTNISAIPGGGPSTDTVTLLNSQNGLSVRLGGGGSTDTLNLADGGNTITVWEDIEIINGGTGDDFISAETTFFNDITQFGGSRTRTYQLGSGNDTVTMSAGNDGIAVDGVEVINGGGGTQDRVALLSGGQTITSLDSVETILGGSGTDSVTLAAGGQSLTASALETAIGGSGDDTIVITDGTNVNISGLAGADQITGGSGADIITGGDGADTIQGGTGADTLTGGGGADRFVFTGNTAAGLGTDTITDFSGVLNFSGAAGDSDVIVLDTSDLDISAINYEEIAWGGTSAALDLTDNTATVIVLDGNAGTRADAAAAIAGDAGLTTTNAVFLFHDSANANKLTMVHSDNVGADGNENTLAVFDNATDPSTDAVELSAADFTLQA